LDGRTRQYRLAGFELESRHAGWTGAESRSHMSVYRLSAE